MLCSWNTYFCFYLLGLNIHKEKAPTVGKVFGNSFLFNSVRCCLADTGKWTRIYEVPLQCPVKFALSHHENWHYPSWEHNPPGQEDRAASPLCSARRCVHVPPLCKSRLPLGREPQQLHICSGEKLSAENTEGDLILPPPPAKQAQHLFLSRWHPDGLI